MASSARIDDELKSRIRQLATSQGRSARWIVREAIQQYVEREEARESFEQEARRSWTDYQATGRHLTGEEVRVWLRNWGTEDETDLPECHGSS